MPSYLIDYDVYFEKAIKEKCKGRASGGLLVLIRKSLKVNVITKNNLWIFLSLSSTNDNLIIGITYWKPDLKTHEVISMFNEELLIY